MDIIGTRDRRSGEGMIGSRVEAHDRSPHGLARIAGCGLAVVAMAVAAVACSPPAAPAQAPPPAQSAPAPAAASAAPAEAARPAEPVVVRVGLQGGSSDAAAFIADAKGYFREQGIAFEHVPFSAPPAMVAPLATSQIDVAGVGPNPQYVNAVARDVPIKAVADKGRFSRGGGYIAFAVRK